VPLVDAAGARIHYQTHGDGEPLLLIPGFSCSASIYSSNVPALAERFRVIVPDPRGAGRSDAPPGPYTMAQIADDLALVLYDAGVESAHVLGTSFGGMVAQHLALRHPSRVRRLVLGCTTPGAPAHVPPPAENMATFMAAAVEPEVAKAVRMRQPLQYTDAYFEQHAGAIIGRACAEPPQSPDGRLGQTAAAAAHDAADALHRIAAPTLVAHGDDDGVVPVANAHTIAARIPGARLQIYEGARHLFFIERAAEFNADVLDFLA
jgi:pimeloyl-ACP methyl ester carboxylesterase